MQDTLRAFDVDGDGTVSKEEVAVGAKLYIESKKTQKKLVQGITVVTAVLVIALLAIFGLTFAVVELSKETKTDSSGVTTVKGDTSTPVATAATSIDVPLGMMPRLGSKYLRNIGDIVLLNNREQEVKRVVAGIDITSSTSFTLRTTLGDVIVVENAVHAEVKFTGQESMAVCAACSKCASFSVVEDGETRRIRDTYSREAADMLRAGEAPACVGKIEGAQHRQLRTLGDTRRAFETLAGAGALQCVEGTNDATVLTSVTITGFVQFGVPTSVVPTSTNLPPAGTPTASPLVGVVTVAPTVSVATGVTTAAVATVSPTALTGVTTAGIATVAPTSLTGVTTAGIATISPTLAPVATTAVATTGVTTAGIATVSPTALTGVTTAGIATVSPTALTGVTTAGIATVAPVVATGVTTAGVATVAPTALTGVTTAGIATVAPVVATGVTTAGVATVAPTTLTGVTTAGIATVAPVATTTGVTTAGIVTMPPTSVTASVPSLSPIATGMTMPPTVGTVTMPPVPITTGTTGTGVVTMPPVVQPVTMSPTASPLATVSQGTPGAVTGSADTQQGWFQVGGTLPKLTCLAQGSRQVVPGQALNLKTCQKRCEETEWCNYISHVTPDADSQATICWMESDCLGQSSNPVAHNAEAWQLKFKGLHPAVLNDLEQYTKERVGSALGLMASGQLDTIIVTVEVAGETPMLKYTVTLTGTKATILAAEAQSKINTAIADKQHTNPRYNPVAHAMATFGATIVNADARTVAQQRAAALVTATPAVTPAVAAERRHLAMRRQARVLAEKTHGFDPSPRSRRGRTAGWESGLVNGKMADEPPVGAFTAIHVDLHEGVHHLPGIHRKFGGVQCSGEGHVEMNKGILDHVGGKLEPGMLIYGTGCDDWPHVMFARKVVHVHPHRDHPNATVVAAVEPIAMRQVISSFDYTTYLPPSSDANSSVKEDCIEYARENYRSWHKELGKTHRRVSELHDLAAGYSVYRARRARAQGSEYPVDITVDWSLNFPGLKLKSPVVSLYNKAPAEAQQFMDGLGGSYGWPNDFAVSLTGAPPSISLSDGSNSAFHLGLYIRGKGGAKFKCRTRWGWPPITCSIDKYGHFRYEIRGGLKIRVVPYLETPGSFELKFGWGKDTAKQIHPIVGLGLHFEVGIFFSTTQATRLYMGGAELSYNVRLGREITCSPGCRSRNLNTKNGYVDFIAPYGEAPNEPVAVAAGLYMQLMGSICFPTCPGIIDGFHATIMRASVGVEMKFYVNTDLLPGCSSPKKKWVDQLSVPSVWCFGGGCNGDALGAFHRCYAKWDSKSATGCTARKLVDYCDPIADYPGCERCPSGKCEKSSNGDCVKHSNGYLCIIDVINPCPTGQSCWRQGSRKMYSLDPSASWPCVGGQAAKPEISFKIDAEIFLELWVGLEVNTPIGGWSFGLSYVPAMWVFNLYQSRIWRPKFLAGYKKRYWFERRAKELEASRTALPQAIAGQIITTSTTLAWTGLVPGSTTTPTGQVSSATQVSSITGVWLMNQPAAVDAVEDTTVRTPMTDVLLTPGTMRVITGTLGFERSTTLTLNVPAGSSIRTAPLIRLDPSMQYSLRFPTGGAVSYALQIPQPPEGYKLGLRISPDSTVRGDVYKIEDNVAAGLADCFEGDKAWKWDAVDNEYEYPTPEAGVGCQTYCMSSAGSCLYTIKAGSEAFLYWVVSAPPGESIRVSVFHELRMLSGSPAPISTVGGYGPLVSCAPPPTVFPNETGLQLPSAVFSFSVSKADALAGAKVGVPSSQRALDECLENPGLECPTFNFMGHCSVSGNRAPPTGAPLTQPPTAAPTNVGETATVAVAQVKPKVPSAWAQVQGNPNTAGYFTMRCDVSIIASPTVAGPVKLSSSDDISFSVAGTALSAVSQGGTMGVCLDLNITSKAEDVDLDWFVGPDAGFFAPEFSRTTAYCMPGGLASVESGLESLEAGAPVWISPEVVAMGMGLRFYVTNEESKEDDDETPPPPARVALQSFTIGPTSLGMPLLSATATNLVVAHPSVAACDLNPIKIVLELNCGIWPPQDVVPEERMIERTKELLKDNNETLLAESVTVMRVVSSNAMVVHLNVPAPAAELPGLALNEMKAVRLHVPDDAAGVYGKDGFAVDLSLTRTVGACADGMALKFGT
eukprot:TRINITY_DN852_c0_g1_i1.p1 TRINITY_DN852_c0_g1~~TRINITY_DN852_c0_g1_i1.p1  ORF type:complete len:2266 (+),score=458.10 TRINITY_DN852_c0_g1_i1:367-6798(+)